MKKSIIAIASILTAACGFALAAPAPAPSPTPATKGTAPTAPAKAAAPAGGSDDDMMMSAAAPTGAGKVPTGGPTLTPAQTAFFETRVRPILVANCYKCHSAEDRKVKGGLALDTREGWQKGGDAGPAIVPGDPAKSLLIKAINYADADLQMPPDGKRLTPQQIADLTTWVKNGALDPRSTGGGASKLTGLNDKAKAHWAFQPVKDRNLPMVNGTTWVKTPVDAFVLSKLELNGMRPAAPAPKEALIRRATYDLIGLPPTPAEVAAFVADTSPSAFEKVVDRLLASPAYGERWGRYWLDSARYSDTTGQENNNLRTDYRYAHAWTYRDYVIQSFNDDKPYDQFLKEQIAADQLPGTDKDPARLAALGFLTVGKRFQNPNDTIDERIDTVTKATMALTVSCARCHDHKFDPIPTADYYSLHGIFVSTVEPAEKPVIREPANAADYADFKQRVAAIEAKNRDIYFDYVARKSAEFRKDAAAYLLVASYGRKGDAEDIKARNKIINENRLDRDLYQGGFRGGKGRGDGVLAALQMFAQIPNGKFAERADEVLAIVANGGSRRRPINPLVAAAFKAAAPKSIKSMADVTAVYGKLFAEIDPKAKAYIAAARTATTEEIPGFDADLVELFNIPAPIVSAASLDSDALRDLAQRLPAQNNGGYRLFQFAQLNELELTHPGSPARAMSVVDAKNPHNSPIFIRGEQAQRGPVVPRQFLEILSPKDRKPFTVGSGRLQLAEAIASKDNPLTARVMINRLWMRHFGEGLVRTVDDMGVQSEPPSHPEMLDYLASVFVRQGWSTKRMHRMIMLSNTYQQSSETNPAYAAKDPDNRLLWRANLRRLDFEAVRDTMVMFTGKLDRTVGGHPVNLTDEPYSNRRSVYGYIDRGNVPELMDQFDFSDPDMANTKRTATIVPQQALFFMNSPMAVDVARKVTARPEFAAATDDAGRVRALYAAIFQRAPRPEEITMATEFLRLDAVAAAQLADAGDAVGKPAGDDANDSPVVKRRKAARRALAQQAAQQMRRANARKSIQNEGEIVERKPLTAWERYAQALLFTNEIAYVN